MRVTIEQIKSKIKSEAYMVLPDGRTTLCLLALQNGYTIKGMSACVDAANFDLNLGRKYSYEDAIRQIWPLEGYLLAEEMYNATLVKKAVDDAFDVRSSGIAVFKKKPHWTQTPEGKIKMANRKHRGKKVLGRPRKDAK